MITGFLLLPVVGILLWLYAYLLPQRGKPVLFDYAYIVLVLSVAAVQVFFVKQIEWVDAGPIWPELVAVVGAYVIILVGLAGGLCWRRYRS